MDLDACGRWVASPSVFPRWPLWHDQRWGKIFHGSGAADFRSAAALIHALAYGRTSRADDYSLVLIERRGTCSSKHGLLASLGVENGLPIGLCVGIFEMAEATTPGVGQVLEEHGLSSIPEAHSYLTWDGTRVDLTGLPSGLEPPELLYEESVRPEVLTALKPQLHRSFLDRWANQRGLNARDIWEVREACIAALQRRS